MATEWLEPLMKPLPQRWAMSVAMAYGRRTAFQGAVKRLRETSPAARERLAVRVRNIEIGRVGGAVKPWVKRPRAAQWP